MMVTAWQVWMDGGVSGGGYGEVFQKDLTIGKADKQGDCE